MGQWLKHERALSRATIDDILTSLCYNQCIILNTFTTERLCFHLLTPTLTGSMIMNLG
jgi:hypothetical protein